MSQNCGNVACRLRFADLVVNETVLFKVFTRIFIQVGYLNDPPNCGKDSQLIIRL